jgi:hypothetical protein
MDSEKLLLALSVKPMRLLAERLKQQMESNEGMARAYSMERCDNMAMGYETRAETLRDIIETIEEVIGEIEQ